MIIYTKNTVLVETPLLYAYDEGVFVFPFYGTETYTDPYDSSVWTWENVTNDIDEIVSIIAGGVNYKNAYSLANCIETEESFFWDDTNGWLYVHHTDSDHDCFYGSEERKYGNVVSGYSTGYNDNLRNMFDSVYYETRIQDFASITRTSDPIQFGLVTFNNLNYELINQDSEFDSYTKSQSVGTPFFVYAVDEDDTTTTALTQSQQIFQGYHNGINNTRSEIKIDGIEQRFFDNKPVCINTLELTEFPNAADMIGELKPVAFGKIYRGICVPTNQAALTDSAGSVVLLLADPELGDLTSVDYVYSKEGDSLSIVSTDLTACTVTVTKPADIKPAETKEYTWQGIGYDIDVDSGTVYNGLNIVKECFVLYNKYIYSSNFFDLDQWSTQILLKTAEVGISVQSSKGWIEEILQPISTSLQGVFEYKGNGILTFFPRDIDGYQYLIDPDYIEKDTEFEYKNDVVSEVYVEYSPDFKNNKYLSFLFTDYRDYVINNYNIETRGSVSPIKTVLYNSSDAEVLAETLNSIYKNPVGYYNITLDYLETDRNLFDIVAWNDKRYFGSADTNKAGEVISISYDFIDEKTILRVREVDYNANVVKTFASLITTEMQNIITTTGDNIQAIIDL